MAVMLPSSRIRKQGDELVMPTCSVDGQSVQLAPLQTVSLAKIYKGDFMEIHHLNQAARYPGFFYLEVPESMQADTGLPCKIANELLAQDSRENRPREPAKARFIQVRRESVLSPTGQELPAGIRPKLPALRDSFRVADEICMILLQKLNVKARTTSRMTMITAGDMTPTSTSNANTGTMTVIFPAQEPALCTTEIFMPGAGLSHDQSWAQVVPKHRSVVIGLGGARHRICGASPGGVERVWAQYETY